VRGFLALAAIATAEKNPTATEQNQLKAVAADPLSFDANIALARLYVADDRKDYVNAERYAKQAVKADAGRAGGYAVLAGVYSRTDRWSDLDAILSESEKRVPGNLVPYFQSGLALLAVKKDAVRAERYFRKYLTQEAEGQAAPHSRAHWRLGQALEQQGRTKEAIAEIQAATKLEPDFQPARADLKRLGG
jgi:tetratricopeptide (TPR) repeat protein